MKKIAQYGLALSIGLFSSASLLGQNIQTSVYFESGKAKLTEESKAELDQLVREAKDCQDFDLDIKAFTDDIGSEKYNQRLARRRAAAVQRYLDAAQLTATRSEVNGVGELALQTSKDIDAQRQQNRRVDIAISPFQPESLSDFYNYFFQRNQQKFEGRLDKDIIITGRQGTELYIPAQSLQLVGGGEVNNQDVVITLQEAYDLQDMIFNNLGTVSHGELIETGGMVYIDAKTKDGRQLEVKPGAELGLTMLSEQKLDKDMQLFYADRDATAMAQPINWEATNQPFTSTNFDQERPEFDFSKINFPTIPNIEDPKLIEWPEIVNKPNAPYAPRVPNLRNDELPNKEDLIAENPQKRLESDRKYEERITQLMENAEKQVKLNIRLNKSAQARYELQQAAYQEALAEYKQELANFEQMKEQLIALKSELISSRANLMNWFETFKWSTDFNKELVRIIGRHKKLDEFKKYLQTECERFGLTAELNQLAAMEFENQEVVKKVAIAFARCIRANYDFYKNHKIGEVKAKVGDLLDNFEPAMGDISRAHSMVNGTYEHAELLNRLIDNYNEVLVKSGYAKHAQELDKTCEILLNIQEKVLTEKSARGLLSDEEVESVYRNTVGINRLGWINCDRFINIPMSERVLVSVNQEKDDAVQLYATFSSVKGVMPLRYSNNLENAYEASGIPKDETVRIIGLRVKNGSVQAAVYEGQAQNMEKIKLNFKNYKLGELRNLLS